MDNLQTIDGTIEHAAGKNNFTGVMTVAGDLYALTGSMSNKVIEATLSNRKSTITWKGAYEGGEDHGNLEPAIVGPQKGTRWQFRPHPIY